MSVRVLMEEGRGEGKCTAINFSKMGAKSSYAPSWKLGRGVLDLEMFTKLCFVYLRV